MERWYTLYTKPNAEYRVAQALERRGMQTFLPEIEAPKARNGRNREPFFPCYLFVRIDLKAVGLRQVQWTPGLRRIIAFDDRPAPLDDEVIDLIRDKLERVNAAGGWPAHNFRQGDAVRITDGPMQGMLAVFEKPSKPAERVQVLLTILGQASRTWVPVTNLEKAPPDAEVPTPRPAKRPRRTRGRGRRIKSSGAGDAHQTRI